VSVLLSEIIKELGASIDLSQDITIDKVASLDKGCANSISFLGNPKYAKQVSTSKASAILVPLDFDGDFEGELIPVSNPSSAFSVCIKMLGLIEKPSKIYISDRASIDDTAKIGENCSIGHNCVISENAIIEDNVVLGANCFVGVGVRIGKNSRLYPSVIVYNGCIIGANVVIHSNTTIGSDGFGFEMEGDIEKIPQVGIVTIAENVEIGANVSIDRARFDATKIGKNTKIDNLVQIGHNVEIGEGCFIVAQVGIAGSSKIGNGVILAGQCGVVGHVSIGDGVIVAAKTGIGHDVEAGARMSGFYGVKHKDYMKQEVCVRQLPALMKKVKKLLK